MHGAGVPEAHLGLGRVDIDVDPVWVDGKKQAERGLALAMQYVFVGLTHRVGEELVAHEAPVDKEELQVATCTRPTG